MTFVAGSRPRVTPLPKRLETRLHHVYGYIEYELGHADVTHVRVSVGEYDDGRSRHVVLVNEFTEHKLDLGIVSIDCAWSRGNQKTESRDTDALRRTMREPHVTHSIHYSGDC